MDIRTLILRIEILSVGIKENTTCLWEDLWNKDVMVIPWLSNCYQFILTVVWKSLVVVHVALQVIVTGSMKKKMEQ